MSNKIKIGINISAILIVLGLVLFFSLKDNYHQIIKCIAEMDYNWFLIGVLCLILCRILSGISFYLTAKINGENISLSKCIKLNFIILFFNGVTPFAGGGQPMTIYYLHKQKISVTKSTNIVLQNFIIYQISLILIGTIAVIYNHYFHLFADDSLIKKLVVLGFLVNLIVLIATCIFSFYQKLNKFICNSCIKFLGKIKIIKDVEVTREKLTKYLNNFHKNGKILKKNKLKAFKILLINILSLVIQYSIPFAVVYALGTKDLNYLDTIVTTAYTMIIGSFVPIPGGTGGIEYGYIFFFGYLISGNILTASMLIWRLISYYLGIIIGAICLITYRKRESKCA